MKREIKRHIRLGDCCPGHDKYPNDSYANNRSKRARARGIAKEHRHARRLVRQEMIHAVSEAV
ncbi:hypothetical protein AAY80_143 [Stenotrophomonas phage vB_SmaS-DLP_6]|nr:hypothetical protein AAY80_143 [Stenotrophomonas phage vB_SmaS-DLP_6]